MNIVIAATAIIDLLNIESPPFLVIMCDEYNTLQRPSYQFVKRRLPPPAAMEKGYEIEFREDHVHVHLSPDYAFDRAGREEIWRQLSEICDQHKTCRVLVEGKLPLEERSTADVVDAGQHTAAVPRLWLALHFDDYVETEQSEIYEKIAASKGVRVKHFTDRDHALLWLRNNAPR